MSEMPIYRYKTRNISRHITIGAKYCNIFKGWFYTVFIDGIPNGERTSFNYYPSKRSAIKAARQEWLND